MKNKLFASLTGLAVVLGAVFTFSIWSANSDAASLPRDCDTNSIINCGATTPDELRKFYKDNKTGDLPAVYSHYGISASMINGVSGANLGEVHKDGRITLNGKVVATGAKSIGRKDVYKPSSKLVINGKTYYEHEPKTTFGVPSIKAWIFLKADGSFIGAILTSCGNPVRATPTPVPTYKCESLAAKKLARDEYTFTAKASAANGASIVSYSYDFGDGKSENNTSKTTLSHKYDKPGNYTAKLTVNVKVNGQTKAVTSESCKVPVAVSATPTYSCDSLTSSKIAYNKYGFTAKASAANGATITGYAFDFGDGKTASSATPSVSHTYEKAGTYTAKVSVTVKVDGATKTITGDKCKVTVTTDKPSYKCDALGARLISEADRSYAYDLSYTVTNGATLKTVDFDFGDGQTKNGVTVAELKDVKHAYAKAGTYKTVATLHFNVEGAIKDVKCETSIKIAPEMCPLIPSLPKDDPRCAPCPVPGKEHLPKDSPLCKEVENCPIPGKEHLPKDSPLCKEDEEKCEVPGKEHLPKDSPDCKEVEKCDVPGKEHLPKNSPDCVETPAELPKTGMGDFIGGGIGIAAIIAAAYYWVISRRALADSMLNR